MQICSVEGCDRPARARGWCKNHYERHRIYGRVTPAERSGPLDEYQGRAVGQRADPCWPWVGFVKPDGYGLYTYRTAEGRRTSTNAHRAVYEMLVGPIPDGLMLDHLCRNTRCVNPAHLEPVTNGENVWRGLTSRGVFSCGHPVTPENVKQTKGQRRCLTCVRVWGAAQKRRWRAANPEKMKERNERYYAANAERLKQAERERQKARRSG